MYVNSLRLFTFGIVYAKTLLQMENIKYTNTDQTNVTM